MQIDHDRIITSPKQVKADQTSPAVICEQSNHFIKEEVNTLERSLKHMEGLKKGEKRGRAGKRGQHQS